MRDFAVAEPLQDASKLNLFLSPFHVASGNWINRVGFSMKIKQLSSLIWRDPGLLLN